MGGGRSTHSCLSWTNTYATTTYSSNLIHGKDSPPSQHEGSKMGSRSWLAGRIYCILSTSFPATVEAHLNATRDVSFRLFSYHVLALAQAPWSLNIISCLLQLVLILKWEMLIRGFLFPKKVDTEEAEQMILENASGWKKGKKLKEGQVSQDLMKRYRPNFLDCK